MATQGVTRPILHTGKRGTLPLILCQPRKALFPENKGRFP